MKRPVSITLVQPPLRNRLDAATPAYVDKNRGHTPPLGLLYLHAAAQQAGHRPLFLDADLEGLSHQETAQRVTSARPDAVGISAMTFTLRDALAVAREIKRLSPGLPVLMGGPHPSVYPEETARLHGVDYAFSGEGERGLALFLDAFDDEFARARIPGITCVENGALVSTPPQPIEDLDSLPFPARHASSYARYTSVLAHSRAITTMITSRGCPYQCIFCNRMGRRLRQHSAEHVLREFDAIHALGIGEVFIHDDTFTINPERVKAICRGLIERGRGTRWEARTRVDCVDLPLLRLMRQAGCTRVSFGVESGSPKVLKAMRKGIDTDRAEQVFAWCRQAGLITLADFMIGNLDEDEKDIAMSVDLMKRLDPDYVQWSILSPYPNTPIYELAMERGVVPGDVWRDFARDPERDFACPHWTEHFDVESLRSMARRNYQSFYLRPAFIFRQLRRIHSVAQFKTMLRGALGMLLPGLGRK